MTPSPLPPEIRVEHLPDGVRYHLPGRPLNFLTVIHAFLGGIGLLLLVFPYVPTLLAGGRFPADVRLPTFWFFHACPGIVTAPLGLFLMCYSLLLLFGRVELLLTPTHLVGTLRVGWLMGWVRLRLTEIRGFRVENHMEEQAGADGTMPPAGIANLKAERADGKTSWVVYAYPGALLDPLAAELAARLEGHGMSPSVEARRLDPRETRERPEQPAASTAVFSASADGAVIGMPALGLWRGNPPALLLFVAVWNLILWPAFFFMLYETAAGRVPWDQHQKTSVPFVLLFHIPFWVVAAGVILWVRHNAVRRTLIRIRPDRLTVESTGVFGTSERSWERGQIRALRAETHAGEKDGIKVWSTGLRIEQVNDEWSFLFTDRPREEVEWIATTIRDTMAVPAAVEPAPDDSAVNGTGPPAPASPPGWTWRRWAMQGLLYTALGLCGWEWRSGHDSAGKASTLYFGPVFFFARAPQAQDLPEAKQYPGVSVWRWYIGGTYRTASSVGKVK